MPLGVITATALGPIDPGGVTAVTAVPLMT
jgi:hypothetical protein